MNNVANRVGIAVAFLTALVAFCALWVTATRKPTAETGTVSATYPPFRTAVDRVTPSVVTIEVYSGARETYDWYARTKLVENKEGETHDWIEPEERTGSGIVIGSDGTVVTANHIFQDADWAMVRLADGRTFPARKFASDLGSDLALLSITGAADLSEPAWADSDQLQRGDWVITVGSPFGLEGSIGAGIVTCSDRELPLADVPLIQSDAASNPGNSGGALVNQAGEIVGICTGGSSMSGGSDGVSYAIPSNIALLVIQQLRQQGKVSWPLLGIEIQSMTPDVAEKLGAGSVDSGVVITEVKPSQPGDRAGLKTGDIIVRIQQQPVRSPWEYRRLLLQASHGDSQVVEIIRRGRKMELHVQPEYSSENDDIVTPVKTPNHRVADLRIVVTDASNEGGVALGLNLISRGVLIEQVLPDGIGHRNHLLAGMVILQVGQSEVDDPAEFHAAIAKESTENGILLLIATSDGSQFRVIK